VGTLQQTANALPDEGADDLLSRSGPAFKDRFEAEKRL
jgi:hypothetical protein